MPIQAMASLSYLQPYLDSIYTKAECVEVPTPVLDALVAQFQGTLPVCGIIHPLI